MSKFLKIFDVTTHLVTHFGGAIIGLHLANNGRPGDRSLFFIGGLLGFAKPLYMAVLYFGLEITQEKKISNCE